MITITHRENIKKKKWSHGKEIGTGELVTPSPF